MESQESLFTQEDIYLREHENRDLVPKFPYQILKRYNPYNKGRRSFQSVGSNSSKNSVKNMGNELENSKCKISSILSTEMSQSSENDCIPCFQNKIPENTQSSPQSKVLIENLENISKNLTINELHENLSKSTIASFDESFNLSIMESKPNNMEIKSSTVTQSSNVSLFKSQDTCDPKNEIPNQNDKTVNHFENNKYVEQNNFMNETNDSFMLNVPLNISNFIDDAKVNIDNLRNVNYFYGLPLTAKSLISQYKGIDKLYEWQNECLTLPAVTERQNLIYALPTSGGKTLVAEILMLKEVLCRKKNVLFVLPFVSIVQEKVWGLSPFAVGLDFFVEEYAGGKGTYPPRKRRQKRTIYISTLEKGLGLVRSLLEAKRLSEIGLIVVDELHLLGDPSRGCILEMLLSNVLFSKESIQIIGMSATIGNISELGKFLNAQIFTRDFRPVELKEYVKCGKSVMSIDYKSEVDETFKLSRTVDYGYSSQVEKLDPDHLGGLVMEVIPNNSCLIFCPTKKNAENVAVLLCKVISKAILEHRKQEKTALEKALKDENKGDNLLLSLIPWGVAYHHSGLAFEERRLIEDAFRTGILCALCCTSTLAAGVNLPAQRVILRAPLVGKNFISLSMYKQMVGRAGRAGLGEHGESILICAPKYAEKVKALLSSPMDDVCSSLHINDNSNMRSFLLSAVASETATNLGSLKQLANQTLLAVQAERLNIVIKKLVQETIRSLFKMGAITLKNDQPIYCSNINISVSIDQTMKTECTDELSNENVVSNKLKHTKINTTSELVVSKLGKAAVKGGMPLSRAHQLYADLKEAQSSLVLIGIMHLLYLITPYELAETIKPNLLIYYSVLNSMDPGGLQTSRILGFNEATKVKMAMGKLPKNIPQRVLNRFYVTLMLYDLWNQVPLQAVSEKYMVNRGTVQSMMEQAGTFASGVYRFCEELEEMWAFKDLLSTFTQRLSHCCITELIPLMDLPNVKKNRAMQLYKAGYKTLKNIADATPNELIDNIEHVTLKTANQLIAASKLILLEKMENLKEEYQDAVDELGVKEENR